MDKRVQTIYDRLQSREYRSLRSGKEYSFAQDYAAAGTDPALRAADRLMKMAQAERVQGIRRELCIDGTPNRAYDSDEGYTFELFVPYSVFGTDEISDYRIAAGVRSRANIPGGTETAFGAWSAAEQAAFTGVSPAQWVALADAL